MTTQMTTHVKVYCTEDEKAMWAEIAFMSPIAPGGSLSGWLRELAYRRIAEMDYKRDERDRRNP